MKRNFLKKCTAVLCSAIMMGGIISYVPLYAESANLISNAIQAVGTLTARTAVQAVSVMIPADLP